MSEDSKKIYERVAVNTERIHAVEKKLDILTDSVQNLKDNHLHEIREEISNIKITLVKIATVLTAKSEVWNRIVDIFLKILPYLIGLVLAASSWFVYSIIK